MVRRAGTEGDSVDSPHAQACDLWVLGPEIPRVLAVAQDVYYGDVERGDVRV